jgi:hypothetical protein
MEEKMPNVPLKEGGYDETIKESKQAPNVPLKEGTTDADPASKVSGGKLPLTPMKKEPSPFKLGK